MSKTKQKTGSSSSVLTSSDDGELIRDLRSLGFGEYEARAYIGLLQCGPATAYEVAKISGLPRANVYGILKTLAEKGVAQPINEKPVRYMPVGPEEVFQRISESTSRLCKSVRTRLSSVGNKDGREYVWIYKGEAEIIRKIFEILQTAEKHVLLKGTDNYIKLLLPEIEKACSRGVSIVLILFTQSVEPFTCHPNCKVFLHEANGIIVGGAAHFITVTADTNKAFIAKVIEGMEAAYSENYSFVYGVDVMIKHEIYLAQIIHRFKDDIEREFGPGLSDLRKMYSSSPPSAQFDEYVQQRLNELKKL
jgi:sugar-specific transcriptional regulator TrmB